MTTFKFTLNNTIIEARSEDGFMNATHMCQVGGKNFNNWYKLKHTKELFHALEQILEKEGQTDIEVIKTDNNNEIWIHPDLGIQLAQWISPTFMYQVSKMITEHLFGRSVSSNS